MKKLFVFAALAAPLFFFSCAKEMEPALEQDPEDAPVVANVAFKASIEELGSPTKADINASNQLVWASGDKIGIFVNDGGWAQKNQPFVLVGAGGSTTGSFNWDVEPAEDFTNPNATVAYFPWNGTNTETDNNVYEGTLYYKLPQGYYEYTSGKMLTPLVAKITRTGEEYDDLQFYHAGAAVKVKINNLPAYSKSIGLSVDGKQIRGKWHVNPANAGTDAMALDDPENTSLNDVWLNFEPSGSEREFTFLFPVPTLPASSKLNFVIYDKNDVKVWAAGAKTAGDVALARGNVLAMPALSITPYGEYDQISAWSVIGSWDSWVADVPMITEVDGEFHIANDIAFDANAEFKIRKDGKWDESYGYSDLASTDGLADASGNIKVLAAGTYDVIFNSSTHKIKVVAADVNYPDAGTMPHHTSIKKATNLGATETANCYVVKAAGKYKIPGVKGNSATSVGTIAGVQLLWETYNNGTSVTANSVIEAIDYDATDNCVYFKTPDVLQAGNALIAATDGTDILWSWHIWIPSSAITDIGEYAVSSKYYMDRNLGALTVATASTTTDVEAGSLGLYYQWGRKDPFIGPRAKGSGSLAKYNGTTQTSTSESVDMDYAIAHPTTLAKNNDWNDGITDRWGQGGSKTIYDPCPAGYRIPEYNSSEALWQDATSDGSFVANGAHGWWKIGTSFIFPMAGEGGYDYAEHVFDRNKIWTAKQLDDSHPQYGLGQYIYYLNTDPKDTWTSDELGSWQSKPSWGIRKRYTASVRCQKIDGEVPAPDLVGATSVVMDGAFTDWTGADAITTDSGRLPEWKFGWDASNFYLYFKVTKNRIDYNETSKDYDWESYIYVGIDTDNNASTGARVGGGTDMETGGEVKILIYPWRGNYDADNLSIVSGVDSQSSIQRPVGTTLADVHASIKGDFVGDYCYLEVSIPRSALGELSSKIAVAPCMNYSTSHRIVIPVYD